MIYTVRQVAGLSGVSCLRARRCYVRGLERHESARRSPQVPTGSAPSWCSVPGGREAERGKHAEEKAQRRGDRTRVAAARAGQKASEICREICGYQEAFETLRWIRIERVMRNASPCRWVPSNTGLPVVLVKSARTMSSLASFSIMTGSPQPLWGSSLRISLEGAGKIEFRTR
jgi:hypothetical protein